MPHKRTNIFNPEPMVGLKPESTTVNLLWISPVTSNNTAANITPDSIHPCKWILYEDIHDSNVRLWDLLILLPNVIFLLFLLLKVCTSYEKLKTTSSPIFTTFYILVWAVSVISLFRCISSMAIYPFDTGDQILWVVLRFFLLATEFSVVIFGIAFGHLDSRTSIRRVLLVTTLVALAYSTTQGCLEILQHDDRFNYKEYSLFGHGGMLFWFASSLVFFVVYVVIVILPYTRLGQRLNLPTKKSFYRYCGYLAILNLSQAIGSGLLYYHILNGMCVVDVTAYLYFTGFAPLVYWTFLRSFFRTSKSGVLFSYKTQVDDNAGEEDNVSLPYQTNVPGNKMDANDPNNSIDSTHLDASGVDVIIHSDSMGSINSSTKDHSKNPLYDLSINTDFFNQPV